MSLLPRFRRFVFIMPFLLLLTPLDRCAAQDKKSDTAPDTLVLSNGDTLHGKLVQEVGGTVTFHSDPLGDLTIKWSAIKELHAGGSFAVLNSDMKHRGRKAMANLPEGSIDATGDSVSLQPTNQATAPAPIPTKNAEVIVTLAELDKQLHH